MSHCSFCDREVSPSLGINFRKCKHWAHAKCIDQHYSGKGDEKINYRHCPQCLGETTVNEAVEPFPHDGIDYVRNPGDPLSENALNQVKSRLFGSHADEMQRKQKTLALIQQRTPLDVLWRRHEIGLQHMLRDGVLLGDLLANGYTWSNMFSKSKDFQQGRRRSCDVFMALGASANHIRDFPDALPLTKLTKDAKLEPSDFCTVFGLCFPDGQTPLQCDGDFDWDAQNAVDLGLTAPDLFEFGLCNMQQYQALFANLSEKDFERLEKRLGFTEEMVERLMQMEQPERYIEEEEEKEERYYQEEPNPAYAIAVNADFVAPQQQQQRSRPQRGLTALERTRIWREKRTQQRLKRDGFLG